MCSRPSLVLTVPTRGRAGISQNLCPEGGPGPAGPTPGSRSQAGPDLTALVLVPYPDQEPDPVGKVPRAVWFEGGHQGLKETRTMGHGTDGAAAKTTGRHRGQGR